MSNHAVFIDRDGTMAKDVPYCSRPEDFHLYPGVAEAIRTLNKNDFKVVVITNQSGVGRGYFTEETLHLIHQKMIKDLELQCAQLDGIYYCPHHPEAGCDCRKPKTGLFLKAQQDLDIDFECSYMIGDMAPDIKAGKAVGCRTILVTNGVRLVNVNLFPNRIASDFAGAVDWILISENHRQFLRASV